MALLFQPNIEARYADISVTMKLKAISASNMGNG